MEGEIGWAVVMGWRGREGERREEGQGLWDGEEKEETGVRGGQWLEDIQKDKALLKLLLFGLEFSLL